MINKKCSIKYYYIFNFKGVNFNKKNIKNFCNVLKNNIEENIFLEIKINYYKITNNFFLNNILQILNKNNIMLYSLNLSNNKLHILNNVLNDILLMNNFLTELNLKF